MKYRIIVLLLLEVVLNSCGPSKASIAKSELALLIAKQNKGKEIFENNCAKCHKLYDTKAYSIEKWHPILYDMQKKAHLTDADMDKILAYISK